MSHDQFPAHSGERADTEATQKYAERFSVGPKLAEKIAAFDSESGGSGLHAGGAGFGESELGSAAGMSEDTAETYVVIDRKGGSRTPEDALRLAVHDAAVEAGSGASQYKLVCPPSERVVPTTGADGTSLAIGRGFFRGHDSRVHVVETVVKRGASVPDGEGGFKPGEVLDYAVDTRPGTREESEAMWDLSRAA